MTAAIKPILKYPGGKWALCERIVKTFQPHKHYIEPYTGSGAVFFNKKPSRHEVVNDLDGRIVNAFKMVRERGDELARLIELTPYARSEYHLSYEESDDPLESARRFFVRSWMAHGFKMYCRTGWRNNGSVSLQPITNLWNDVPRRIMATVERLKCAEIESTPAIDLIERYNTADTLVYVDPPYPLKTRKGRKMYKYEMTDTDHVVLLDTLDKHKGQVVLSGYHYPLYDERLKHWPTIEMQATADKGGTRIEVLWINRPIGIEQQSLFDEVVA